MVPLIETARLRLRGFQKSDLDAQAALLADPQVVRYLGATPMSREEAWRRLLTATGLWAVLGYGYWMVERRDDGTFLGQTGFADFKRDLVPNIEGLPEMGWIFAPHAQGRGFALEAVTAALAWAEGGLKGREIVAIVDPDNAPSIRLAGKAGFDRREDALYKGDPILLFRR